MKECPRCNLINPPDALNCDCGFDFSSKSSGNHRSFIFRNTLVKNIGIGLFLLALISPLDWQSVKSASFGGGLFAVIYTPFFALKQWQINQGDWYRAVMAIGLLISWTANFTVFFKLPTKIALVAMIAPWCAFICAFSLTSKSLPFYFWALGIALIHLSKILKSWQK